LDSHTGTHLAAPVVAVWRFIYRQSSEVFAADALDLVSIDGVETVSAGAERCAWILLYFFSTITLSWLSEPDSQAGTDFCLSATTTPPSLSRYYKFVCSATRIEHY